MPARMKVMIVAAALILATGAAVQVSGQAENLLQKAIQAETVDGDLKAAIALYEKAVAAAGGNRGVAAKALVQMGECYEKLGDAGARKAYERVVQDYADQAEQLKLARTRLAALSSPAASASTRARQVWAEPTGALNGGVSPDGRYISFSYPGGLALHDLVTGADRFLTNEARAEPYPWVEVSFISPDGKQVAYVSCSDFHGCDLRLIDLNSKDPVTPRVLYASEDVSYIWLLDWSRDGRWIGAWFNGKGIRWIGLLSVADGSLRVLKSFTDYVPPLGGGAFSPDGRYLAFNPASGEQPTPRDILLLPTDGTGETIPAVVHPAHDSVVGWTPDGSRLLFTSDRTGSRGLWGISTLNGKPQGAAELIRPDIGSVLGLTASGALYYVSRISSVNVQVASIDFATGKLLSPPVNPIPDYVGLNSNPEWSQDGRFMAYMRQNRLVIRSLESGQNRELRPPQLRRFYPPRWSPDGRSFAVRGLGLKEGNGIYLIDAQNGAASLVVRDGQEVEHYSPQWGADATKIYFERRREGYRAFVERDLVSGAEREIVRRTGQLGPQVVSPDGKWFATGGASGTGRWIEIIPIAGGEPREVFRVEQPDALGYPSWTPDSNSIIVGKRVGQRLSPDRVNFEYWHVPLSGKEPTKLDLKVDDARPGQIELRVHPDGRRVAYSAGTTTREVWVLENFLPSTTASR